MLHELFLLLSGHTSPILTPDGLPAGFPLVSPSERAILTSLSTLGHLHISLRTTTTKLTTSHPSTIARAVASAIETHHLHAFRTRILAVEASILAHHDTSGAYDIVSLAKVLAGFEGWERTLTYLHTLTTSILSKRLNGADIIDRLRADIHTGFPTLEAVSLHLLRVAETAWLREVSSWVLYGRLPTNAAGDFFIAEVETVAADPATAPEEDDSTLKEYAIKPTHLPGFLLPETAASILFIGRALSIIRLRGTVTDSTAASATSSPEMTLIPSHLAQLRALESPLNPQLLLNAISAIRLSLSRHTLQTLLPAERIIDIVYVLREFFLLGRGEFAVAIIQQSAEGVRNRWRRAAAPAPSMVVKEGEVSAILSRTWGVLAGLMSEEAVDERLDTARDLLYLSLSPAGTNDAGGFRSHLVGVPVSLNFNLTWPLELFLQAADLEVYDALFSYLVAVRKTQLRLQGLWRSRRPVRSAAPRAVLKKREKAERAVWATASLAVFFLETVVEYWQGEVVAGEFGRLMTVLGDGVQEKEKSFDDEDKVDNEGMGADMDTDMADDDIWLNSSTPTAKEKEKEKGKHSPSPPHPHPQQTSAKKQQDPESLMRAHQLYLSRLRRGLFLSDAAFAPLLKRFLTSSDGLAAAIEALLKKHETADLTAEDEADNAEGFATRQCADVRALLGKLAARLQTMDEERDFLDAGEGEGVAEREGGKIDRLLMRLDLGNLVGE